MPANEGEGTVATLTQDALGRMKALSSAHAILLAGLLVALAILFAETLRPTPVYLPNPQGGIWVRTAESFFLCRAALDEPAPCIDMATGTATSYDRLEPLR